jgi:hypothetical protein
MEHPQGEGALGAGHLIVVQLHGVDAAAAKLIILGVGSENGGQKNAGVCALGVKIHCLKFPCLTRAYTY